MKRAENNIYFATNDGQGRGGTYVLRIRVSKATSLVFGGFKRGKSIDVPAGDYVYVGSAMSDSGSTCLARRLLRHATRTSGQGHLIRHSMLRLFPELRIADEDIQPPIGKKFKWNVDYILDLPFAELISVYVLRSDLRLEPIVGDLLEADPETSIIEKGLGANDRPGSTYLLRVDADEAWWSELASRLERTLIDNENAHLARS
ncbi:DUF123 domain-containing protein [Roseiconus lacunae]|uniref:DUF123 domain-containing protein n=1 Tax=Roseiconus lacunae TaxID=2605694 RepID=UPI001E5F742A|nr:DUF123 domain-containing protein [Roseiconus lacunae]MCD0460671.1 DUF123 domain-containing protein [Roseiconus lacunae]